MSVGREGGLAKQVRWHLLTLPLAARLRGAVQERGFAKRTRAAPRATAVMIRKRSVAPLLARGVNN